MLLAPTCNQGRDSTIVVLVTWLLAFFGDIGKGDVMGCGSSSQFSYNKARLDKIDASGARRQKIVFACIVHKSITSLATMTVHARHTSSHALNTWAHLRYGCSCRNGVARTNYECSIWLGTRLTVYMPQAKH